MLPCHRDSGCTTPGCRGNRLERTATGPHKFKLCWPHHKNEKRWGKRPITFGVPNELSLILEKYLEARVLIADPSCPYLLVTIRDGVRFSTSRLTQFWESTMHHWQAPARFSPQVGRHSRCRQQVDVPLVPPCGERCNFSFARPISTLLGQFLLCWTLWLEGWGPTPHFESTALR